METSTMGEWVGQGPDDSRRLQRIPLGMGISVRPALLASCQKSIAECSPAMTVRQRGTGGHSCTSAQPTTCHSCHGRHNRALRAGPRWGSTKRLAYGRRKAGENSPARRNTSREGYRDAGTRPKCFLRSSTCTNTSSPFSITASPRTLASLRFESSRPPSRQFRDRVRWAPDAGSPGGSAPPQSRSAG